MYEIKLDDPTLSKGVVVNLDSVGDIPNGGSITLTEDDQTAFRIKRGKVILGENGPEWELGPTLLQAFKGSQTVVVTKLKTTDRPEDVVEDTTQKDNGGK